VRKLTLPLRTARLNLREFVATDFAAVHAYSSDPRVTRYLFFGPRDEQSTAEYLEELLASQRELPRTRFELAVEEIASGKLIGACDLSLVESNVVDLGYMLGAEQWGKGFATEIAQALVDAAFFDLRAQRVISTVDVNNAASIRVLEKIGMRWEAVYRKHRRAKNRWWDCHLFTLPLEVWEASAGAGAARRPSETGS
jgi:ribosomal-protein-alanine N-acetyltransferase